LGESSSRQNQRESSGCTVFDPTKGMGKGKETLRVIARTDNEFKTMGGRGVIGKEGFCLQSGQKRIIQRDVEKLPG